MFEHQGSELISVRSCQEPIHEKSNATMDCNIFKNCQALRFLGKIMVLFVLCLVGVSAYAVLSSLHTFYLRVNGIKRFGYFLAILNYVMTLIGILSSYFATVLVDPGRVPENWTPLTDEERPDEVVELMTHEYDEEYNLTGSVRPRFCSKCNAWKPPRCHHDRVLDRCVLRMDHYCVWVVNCIGLYNYKSFLLFLLYTFQACAIGMTVLTVSLVESAKNVDEIDMSVSKLLAFIIDTAFCLALGGFIVMHARLVFNNTTTIEMYEKRRVTNWPYDLGWKRNFMEVFGYRICRWPIPILNAEERDHIFQACFRKHFSSSSTSDFNTNAEDGSHGYGSDGVRRSMQFSEMQTLQTNPTA